MPGADDRSAGLLQKLQSSRASTPQREDGIDFMANESAQSLALNEPRIRAVSPPSRLHAQPSEVANEQVRCKNLGYVWEPHQDSVLVYEGTGVVEP